MVAGGQPGRAARQGSRAGPAPASSKMTASRLQQQQPPPGARPHLSVLRCGRFCAQSADQAAHSPSPRRARTSHLSVLGGSKDVVKLLLQHLPLRQRPVGFLLVHKDDVLQHRLADAHQLGHDPAGRAHSQFSEQGDEEEGGRAGTCERSIGWGTILRGTVSKHMQERIGEPQAQAPSAQCPLPLLKPSPPSTRGTHPPTQTSAQNWLVHGSAQAPTCRCLRSGRTAPPSAHSPG